MIALSAPSFCWSFLALLGFLALSPLGASAGMTPDEVLSFNKYKAEAEKTGFAGAQCILAECYRDGVGTIKDAVEAVIWYRKSSEQEFGPAQRELGLLYAKGIGVPKDEIEAYAYLNLAGMSWDVPRDELRALAKKMSRDEIAAGQKRTKELQKEIQAKIAAKKAAQEKPGK